MKRTVIQIARMRLGDVRRGDVINLRPDAEHGWFPVELIRQLPSGDLVATGARNADNIKATPWDLVGIQVMKLVDIPVAAEVDVRLADDHECGQTGRVPAASQN